MDNKQVLKKQPSLVIWETVRDEEEPLHFCTCSS